MLLKNQRNRAAQSRLGCWICGNDPRCRVSKRSFFDDLIDYRAYSIPKAGDFPYQHNDIRSEAGYK